MKEIEIEILIIMKFKFKISFEDLLLWISKYSLNFNSMGTNKYSLIFLKIEGFL